MRYLVSRIFFWVSFLNFNQIKNIPSLLDNAPNYLVRCVIQKRLTWMLTKFFTFLSCFTQLLLQMMEIPLLIMSLLKKNCIWLIDFSFSLILRIKTKCQYWRWYTMSSMQVTTYIHVRKLFKSKNSLYFLFQFSNFFFSFSKFWKK